MLAQADRSSVVRWFLFVAVLMVTGRSDASRLSEAPGEYEIRQELAAAHLWVAEHPRLAMRTRFEADAVVFESKRGEIWELGLELVGLGRDGEASLPCPADPHVGGNRIEYRREGLVEWYVHEPRGVEQGFTLERRPAGDGPLELALRCSGNLTPEILDGGRDARFVDSRGRSVFAYSGLAAWDATGRTLTAELRPTAGGLSIVVEDEDATYPVTVDPLCAVEEAKLLAIDGGASDRFGWSVDVDDGFTAVVGATLEDAGGTDSGAVYVFVRSGTLWNHQAKLEALDQQAGDQFGGSVSHSGETVVVGAAEEDTGGASAGSVYVFVRSGTTWSQQAKLNASDGGSGDDFGFSVSLSGNTLVAGSWQDDDNGSNSGSAYVFVRSGTIWTQQAKLTASDGAVEDWFGRAVSVDGNTALIGAPKDDDGASLDEGSAYVFVRSGTVWSQQAKLTAVDAAADDEFGTSVAVALDRALVGAPNTNGTGSDSGSAYVFSRSGTTWSLESELVASDAASGDSFGIAVALVGGTCAKAIIGAESEDAGASSSGSAYLFAHDGTWSQRAKLVASDAAASDFAGRAVGIGSSIAIVGAYGNDDNGTSSGSAYIWDIADTTAPSVTCPPNVFVDCAPAGGMAVAYPSPGATDDCDPTPTVVCVPPSGSHFPVGTTTVTCTASDCDGNVAQCSFQVTVVADTVPPTIGPCPTSETFECTSPLGSFVFYNEPTATDNCPGWTVSCVPPSGSFLSPGTHLIVCTATDAVGLTDQCSFSVTLNPDTEPPSIDCPLPAFAQCNDGSGGAVVNFGAPIVDDNCDDNVSVTCIPPSGSTFPRGVTNVTCTATDDAGNQSQCFFPVTVIDTVAPVITTPGNLQVECEDPGGTSVSFTVTANDACQGAITPNCAPASGALFPLGATVVNCNAVDAHGNVAADSFTVTVVDTTPPEITVPGTVTVECTSSDGAIATFSVTAVDACDGPVRVIVSPPSGSHFPLGDTSVTASAVDGEGNMAEVSFTVSVVDTTPPAIACPGDITQPCEGTDGTPVTYDATATDVCDPAPVVMLSPPSGHAFPVGTTVVTVTATDSAGNQSFCTFDVTITDETLPEITCPADITQPCAGTDGTPVRFAVIATDDCDPDPLVKVVPPSGALFSVGTTTVTAIAIDDAGNAAFCSFSVTITDDTDPEIACPRSLLAECTSRGGAIVELGVTATDDCDPDPVVACSPESGSFFPQGSTTVTCTATDDAGNSTQCSFEVTVVDTTPPLLVCDEVTVQCLGDEGTPVSYSVEVFDDCDPAPVVKCTPPPGSPFFFGTSRVTCTAIDAAGNSSQCELLVHVVDTIPPEISCSNDITIVSSLATPVSFSAAANDLCDSTVTPVCMPPSGSLFSIGTTTVVCTATDDSGNTSQCSFTVTIVPPSGSGGAPLPAWALLALVGLLAGAGVNVLHKR